MTDIFDYFRKRLPTVENVLVAMAKVASYHNNQVPGVKERLLQAANDLRELRADKFPDEEKAVAIIAPKVDRRKGVKHTRKG